MNDYTIIQFDWTFITCAPPEKQTEGTIAILTATPASYLRVDGLYLCHSSSGARAVKEPKQDFKCMGSNGVPEKRAKIISKKNQFSLILHQFC